MKMLWASGILIYIIYHLSRETHDKANQYLDLFYFKCAKKVIGEICIEFTRNAVHTWAAWPTADRRLKPRRTRHYWNQSVFNGSGRNAEELLTDQ